MPGLKSNSRKIKKKTNGINQNKTTESKFTEPKFKEDLVVERIVQQRNSQEFQNVEPVREIFDSSVVSIIFDNSIERFYIESVSSPVATTPYLDKLYLDDDSNLDNLINSVKMELGNIGFNEKSSRDVMYKQEYNPVASQSPIKQVVGNTIPSQVPKVENKSKRSLEMEVL